MVIGGKLINVIPPHTKKVLDMVLVQIDRSGRIVIPKTLRDALKIKGGDWLDIEKTDNALQIKKIKILKE